MQDRIRIWLHIPVLREPNTRALEEWTRTSHRICWYLRVLCSCDFFCNVDEWVTFSNSPISNVLQLHVRTVLNAFRAQSIMKYCLRSRRIRKYLCSSAGVRVYVTIESAFECWFSSEFSCGGSERYEWEWQNRNVKKWNELNSRASRSNTTYERGSEHFGYHTQRVISDRLDHDVKTRMITPELNPLCIDCGISTPHRRITTTWRSVQRE